MTDTATAEPRHKRVTRGGYFVNDAELRERLGLPEKLFRILVPELEAKHGFPRKLRLWGDRRYMPDVDKWLEHNVSLLTRNPQGR